MFENIKRDIAFWLYPEAQREIAKIGIIREVRSELIKENDRLCTVIAKMKAEAAVDPKNLMRHLMSSVTLDMSTADNYLIQLTTEEIRDMNRWGYELYTSRWWKYLVEWAINTESGKTIGLIPHDRDKSLFGAGRIDGLMILRDEVESRKNNHESDQQKAEPYDEQKIIQEN